MEKKYLEEAIKEHTSIKDLSKIFGLGNSTIRYWLGKYRLKTNGLCGKISWDKDLILASLVGAECKSDVLRNMGVSTKAGNYDTLKKYCTLFNIELPKYTYNRGNKSYNKIFDNEGVFIENSFVSRKTVKNRLLLEGRGLKCEICGLKNVWKEKPLVLILDHINGINNDNRRENIRFVCPNCNSQLGTHCNKNLGLRWVDSNQFHNISYRV